MLLERTLPVADCCTQCSNKRRIREEFENGRHYYELQGKEILLPEKAPALPDKSALAWHNENCYRG